MLPTRMVGKRVVFKGSGGRAGLSMFPIASRTPHVSTIAIDYLICTLFARNMLAFAEEADPSLRAVTLR